MARELQGTIRSLTGPGAQEDQMARELQVILSFTGAFDHPCNTAELSPCSEAYGDFLGLTPFS